jgi:hypothetical protein
MTVPSPRPTAGPELPEVTHGQTTTTDPTAPRC